MSEKETVGKTGIDYGLASAGIGYVCIPRNFDRDIYIKNCFANNTVCLRTENFEFLTDVAIDKTAIQNISFPKDRNENGSVVAWVRIAKHGLPIAIGVFNLKDNGQDIFKENSFILTRKDDAGNVVSITGEPAKGLKIDTINEKGSLDINVLNKFLQAALNFYVQGDVNFSVEKSLNITVGKELNILIKDGSKNNKQTSISYKFGDGLLIKDEFKNIVQVDDSGVQIQVPNTKKVIIGKGENNEPSVLGNKLEDSFNDVIDCINTVKSSVDAAELASKGTPSNAAFKAMKLAMEVIQLQVDTLNKSLPNFKSKTVQISP